MTMLPPITSASGKAARVILDKRIVAFLSG